MLYMDDVLQDIGTRTEQVEEEATTSKIVQMLELVGDSGNGMFMLDKELGKRTMTTGTEEK